jgi:hypothetical protein
MPPPENLFRIALQEIFFQNHPPPPQKLNGRPLIILARFVFYDVTFGNKLLIQDYWIKILEVV